MAWKASASPIDKIGCTSPNFHSSRTIIYWGQQWFLWASPGDNRAGRPKFPSYRWIFGDQKEVTTISSSRFCRFFLKGFLYRLRFSCLLRIAGSKPLDDIVWQSSHHIVFPFYLAITDCLTVVMRHQSVQCYYQNLPLLNIVYYLAFGTCGWNFGFMVHQIVLLLKVVAFDDHLHPASFITTAVRAMVKVHPPRIKAPSGFQHLLEQVAAVD